MLFAPARIAAVTGHVNPLTPGNPANFTLIDPTTPWYVDPHGVASLSHNTPYPVMTLPGRVVHNYLRGVQTVAEGKALR